jgi:hypothetical protein
MEVDPKTSREAGMKTCLFALFVLFAPLAYAQQSVPEIPFDSVPDFLKLSPGMNFGEVAGVAVNSKGHVFVFELTAHGFRISTMVKVLKWRWASF